MRNVKLEKELCSGCAACAQICPKGCISMKRDDEGFCYPQVQEEQCLHCGACERVCPFRNGQDKREPKEAYAIMAKDEPLRLRSSSGGVFSLLAGQVIQKGGTVFGAALSEDCRQLSHIAVGDEAGLERLRGSKYFQSNTSEAFREAEEQLAQGKRVLFSGTPCQIAGLRAFLGKEYDNLLTAEVICHGVPSQLLWEKYVDFRETDLKSSLNRVHFRAKDEGWKQFGLREEPENGPAVFANLNKNEYLQMFLNNYALRPSCYACKARCSSDLILGDFWGAEQIVPEMDDDRGLSLVLPCTAKGTAALEAILPETQWKKVDLHAAAEFNSSIDRSAARPALRETFYRDLNALPFDTVWKHCRKVIRKRRQKAKKAERIYYLKRGVIQVLRVLKLRNG